jgi:hypothetical protein
VTHELDCVLDPGALESAVERLAKLTVADDAKAGAGIPFKHARGRIDERDLPFLA